MLKFFGKISLLSYERKSMFCLEWDIFYFSSNKRIATFFPIEKRFLSCALPHLKVCSILFESSCWESESFITLFSEAEWVVKQLEFRYSKTVTFFEFVSELILKRKLLTFLRCQLINIKVYLFFTLKGINSLILFLNFLMSGNLS